MTLPRGSFRKPGVLGWTPETRPSYGGIEHGTPEYEEAIRRVQQRRKEDEPKTFTLGRERAKQAKEERD